MKKTLILSLILPVLLLIIPLPSLNKNEKPTIPTASITNTAQNTEKGESQNSFRLLLSESKEIITLSADEYIFGVLAAEMPALYHEEALKAQAVAAFSFALRKKAEINTLDYDISDDHTVHQAFISEEEMREKWGENADEYMKKLRAVISEVSGLVLTYEGETALTVYHSVSAGETESAENVWGQAIPYLVSVDSSADVLAKNYIKTFEFTAEDLTEKLKGLCSCEGDSAKWFGSKKTTPSGTVISIEICNTEISGAKLREALGLTSAVFEVKLSDDKFIFTCKGYGHGVGMSQHGANAMAKLGSDFGEILYHYYPDCTLEKR